MGRIKYYRPYEIFDFKIKNQKKILDLIFKFQKKLHIERKIPYDIFPKLYGGSTYWSLTRASLEYVLTFTEEKKALKRMEFTFCPEEMYFQTILLNSKHAEKIINDNLRYIDWTSGRGGFPAFLDSTDYFKIKQSNKIFARKFHEEYSQELKKMLVNSEKDINL